MEELVLGCIDADFLQVNTRWKALAEIYTMHSFAPFSNLKFFVKNRQNVFAIELMNFINSIAKNSNGGGRFLKIKPTGGGRFRLPRHLKRNVAKSSEWGEGWEAGGGRKGCRENGASLQAKNV